MMIFKILVLILAVVFGIQFPDGVQQLHNVLLAALGIIIGLSLVDAFDKLRQIRLRPKEMKEMNRPVRCQRKGL